MASSRANFSSRSPAIPMTRCAPRCTASRVQGATEQVTLAAGMTPNPRRFSRSTPPDVHVQPQNLHGSLLCSLVRGATLLLVRQPRYALPGPPTSLHSREAALRTALEGN